jgi:DNA-binding CsgD family transcriptional regulator
VSRLGPRQGRASVSGFARAGEATGPQVSGRFFSKLGNMVLNHKTAGILRDAARRMHLLPRGDYHLLYDFLRTTMGKIVRVDAFYVGFYRQNNALAYPYTFDQGEYESPGVLTYGEHGVGAWLLRTRKTYTPAMDGGRLLNAGHRFGDTERASRDAVMVPLIDRGAALPRVLGLASMQSYEPHVYDRDSVRAFEWLCGVLVALLRRGHEDTLTLRELTAGDDLLAPAGPSFTDLVVEMSDRLDKIRVAVDRLQAALAQGRDVRGEVEDLASLCTRAQQETFAVLTRPEDEALDALSLLTAREREVAELISKRMSNQTISETLVIALPTVKTHVYNIMKKLDVTQRAEITARLLPLGYDKE